MNHTTAWKLVYYPGSGTYLCSKGHHLYPIFRFDGNNLYFYDRTTKHEVPIARDNLWSLINSPIEQTAPPYQRAVMGHIINTRNKR